MKTVMSLQALYRRYRLHCYQSSFVADVVPLGSNSLYPPCVRARAFPAFLILLPLSTRSTNSKRILVSRAHLHSCFAQYFQRVSIIGNSSWNKYPRRMYSLLFSTFFLSVGNSRKEKQVIVSGLEIG